MQTLFGDEFHSVSFAVAVGSHSGVEV
jgi:hypothetical protein